MNTLITDPNDPHAMPVDIYTRLSDSRMLFIYDDINDKLATDITATLLLKDWEDPDETVSLFINSEGGDIRSVFMIYDMMQLVQCPIETVCVGAVSNEAVLLLAAGTPGKRYATTNALICPSQLVQEKYYMANLADAKSTLDRMQKDNKALMSALAKHTGKKQSEVMKDFERKQHLTAKKAKTCGIIDDVLGVSK